MSRPIIALAPLLVVAGDPFLFAIVSTLCVWARDGERAPKLFLDEDVCKSVDGVTLLRTLGLFLVCAKLFGKFCVDRSALEVAGFFVVVVA